jgi:hypothetical protein
MRSDITNPQPTLRSQPAPGLWYELSDLVVRLRELFGRYRPERHYMRGPGPACRAREAA